MSSAISTFQSLDPRLAISDQINFAVDVGAQSINQQRFASQTFSASQVSVNCLIPSLQVVVDRNVLIRTTFQIAITGTTAGGGNRLVSYPQNLVLAPFPFSQMVSVLTCQINNTSVNSNYEANLACMLRQMKQSELAKYSDFAPVCTDYYQQPTQAGTLSAFNGIETTPDYDVKSRGSFKIISITGDTNAGGEQKTVILTCQTTEPIFCSPFQYGDALVESEAGLSGISSINFNFNLGASLVGRAITWTPVTAGDTLQSVVLQGFTEVEVLMTFLSAKPSQLLPMSCVTPYYELPNYKTIKSPNANAGASFQMQSSIVSPNCIPDAVYIFVRNANLTAIQGAVQNDFTYPITNVGITWNTQSGLLQSATPQQLYIMSKRAGLKTDWLQFSGSAQSATGALNSAPSISTSGSIVCLKFNEHVPIIETYFSASSLGLWSWSCVVDCVNNTAVQTPPLELVTIFFQSGLFQSTSGSSSQYVGVLSKEAVLKCSQEAYITHNDAKRLIGGADKFLAGVMKGSPAKMKALLKHGMGEEGGMSAGAMSAGAVSAGARGGMSGGEDGGRRRVPRTH